MESHKRSGNCIGQSREEKDLFKSKMIVSQVARSVPAIQENIEPVPKAAKKEQSSLSTQWVDKLSLQQKSEYDRLFAELLFRTGIPFAIIESDAMKRFIRAIDSFETNSFVLSLNIGTGTCTGTV